MRRFATASCYFGQSLLHLSTVQVFAVVTSEAAAAQLCADESYWRRQRREFLASQAKERSDALLARAAFYPVALS